MKNANRSGSAAAGEPPGQTYNSGRIVWVCKLFHHLGSKYIGMGDDQAAEDESEDRSGILTQSDSIGDK
jgi:hypothetical protein